MRPLGNGPVKQAESEFGTWRKPRRTHADEGEVARFVVHLWGNIKLNIGYALHTVHPPLYLSTSNRETCTYDGLS